MALRLFKRVLASDIMNKKVLILLPNMTARAASIVMTKNNVRGMPVIDKGKIIGMLTDRDILREIVAASKNADKIKVFDIMSKKIFFVSKTDSIEKVAQILSKNHISRVPVVDNGKLVGLVTMTDVLKVMPNYLRLLREELRVNTKEDALSIGNCEKCGAYETLRISEDGLFVCDTCLGLRRKREMQI